MNEYLVVFLLIYNIHNADEESVVFIALHFYELFHGFGCYIKVGTYLFYVQIKSTEFGKSFLEKMQIQDPIDKIIRDMSNIYNGIDYKLE